MIFLTQNIKYLRKQQGWTQQKLADELNVKRALVGSYEEGRATPKLLVLQDMAALFNLSVDQLIGTDLEHAGMSEQNMNIDFKVLPIVVNDDNEEQIPIVPVKVSAGYLNGYSDPEFIGSLPCFSMPVPELSKEKTYRVFQIKGDSMLPVVPGSYIFSEFVSELSEIKDGHAYILITKDEGLVYKRVFHEKQNKLLLKSDNPDYEPYLVGYGSVLEIWKANGVLSFELPNPEQVKLSQLPGLINELRNELRGLKK